MGQARMCGSTEMIDFYVIESDTSIVCQHKGILDAQTAERIVELIEIKEENSETGFHRVCDLTCLEAQNRGTDADDLERLAVYF